MKKITRRFIAIAVAALIIIMLSASAFASEEAAPEHYGKYGRCDNTGRVYYHTGGLIYSYPLSDHTYGNGVCSRTQQVFNHTQACAVCGYVFTTAYGIPCRITHSSCTLKPYQTVDGSCSG